MGVVFTKTPKGHQEIEHRSGTLTPRVRRVLIFVDGKRSVEDLLALLQSDDLQRTLGALEEDGFIETTGLPEPVQAAPAAAPRPIPTFTPLPDPPDGKRLQMARNFMTNTVISFVGSLGTTSMLDRIERSRTHEELRAIFDEWLRAMMSSHESKWEVEDLRDKLLKVI